MRSALALIFALAAGAAVAAPDAGLSRAATSQEMASFDAYYQKLPAKERGGPPSFSVTRATKALPWSVAAAFELPPQRGYRALCRINRRHVLLADERKGEWVDDGPREQFVWLDQAGCKVDAPRIRLESRLPDTEVYLVLSNSPDVLTRARLLMAGNSSCAALRSRNFAPAALGVGTLGSSPEEMYELSYRSDRGDIARVQIRKNGAELISWNVSCTGPQ